MRTHYVTDYLGGWYFLLEFFEGKDICEELMEQILAEKWIYDIDIWDMIKEELM